MSTPMPSPAHVADLLPAFVNNTLTRDERAQAMGHLTRFPVCTP